MCVDINLHTISQLSKQLCLFCGAFMLMPMFELEDCGLKYPRSGA